MYPDEFRSSEKLHSLHVARQLADPSKEFAELEAMTPEQRYEFLRNSSAERFDLDRRIKAVSRDLKRLKAENSKLKSEKKLAEDRLAKLRQSKSMRLGRALSSPVRMSRRLTANPKAESIRTARQFNRQWRKLKSSLRSSVVSQKNLAESKLRMASGRSRASTATPPNFFRLDKELTPLEVFQKNATPDNLEKLLNFTWFVEGRIVESANLVRENSCLVEELSDRGKQLAQRILGFERLDLESLLPARSQNPAYVAEHKRVMYCVHQTPLFNSNGYSTRTRGVAKGLQLNDKDVVVVGRSGYPWDSKADVAKPLIRRHSVMLDGVDYVHLPGGNLNRDPLDRYFMEAADAFVREACMQRPALIQSASNFRTAIPALIAARRVGVPFVYEVRGLWEFTEASAKPGFENTERFDAMRRAETFVASEADAVLAITRQVKDELVSRGVDENKIILAPNAVDPEVFLPIPRDEKFAERHRISTEVPVIGFAGSMVAYEGLDLLLDASASLHARGVEHQIVLAGSGAAEPGLKQQTKDLGIDDKVRFLGRLSQEQMPRLQSTFDIVCCPRKSTIVTELVSPLKPLESFATQKATVLSDVAPNRDLAGEGSARALIFKADDSADLERTLERVIEDSELRADLGRSARLWAVTERTWRAVGSVMTRAHILAAKHYSKRIIGTRHLGELHVGVIGDEFTRTTLAGSFSTELISRQNWRDQLEAASLDLIIIESAWEGNGGEWARGIGHYSDEESADLRGLLKFARSEGIPTLFWNKEDPVHFARFAPNAALCDHVFTTDANMIPKYHSVENQRNVTISSLPFYAQPKIHNPLPKGREYSSSVAYAGSYYGERYAQRSKSLDLLLSATSDYPLAIYDRQANNPDSPYTFPEKYRSSVRGALPYDEVIKSYQSHLAHLNVNSVLDSPTMFSRRVVEIPACGGIVLSAFSRGISETLGSNIANSNSREDYEAWLHAWSTNPHERLSEIWRQMRTVYRAHTTETALAIMMRTAGIAVAGLQSARYIAVVSEATSDSLTPVLEQSVTPVAVVLEDPSEDSREYADSVGVPIYPTLADVPLEADYQIFFDGHVDRTFAEDVLLPLRFTETDTVFVRHDSEFTGGTPIVEYLGNRSQSDLSCALVRTEPVGGNEVVLTLPKDESDEPAPAHANTEASSVVADQQDMFEGKKVLVAGHDLKFAQGLLTALRAAGAEVLLDEWKSHTKHDEQRSLELLEKTDFVFCEWGLGNAVWYSHKIRSEQRLVVRVHSQELFRPYLAQIACECVDSFIFVSELIRSAAVVSHGVPRERTTVIPNPVDIAGLNLPKTVAAEKTIGFVGIVPRSKRLDLALDVLEGVLREDPEYVLRIKGKTPEDYPWMENRPQEMDYFNKQYARIEQLNRKYPGCVVFDGFGSDMAEWYAKVGVVLSTSDFESFHLTIADGAASGARPVCLNWPGADLIYPTEWLVPNVACAVDRVLRQKRDSRKYRAVAEAFKSRNVFKQLLAEIRVEKEEV